MKVVAYCLYIFLCAFVGVVCVESDIDIKDWRYWAILGSVIAAYLCGKCQ